MKLKFLNFDRVLCLSPHPDDVEYSMAGTIIKHTGTTFDILCLTQGGDCDDTTGENRLKEVENSWKTEILKIQLQILQTTSILKKLVKMNG